MPDDSDRDDDHDKDDLDDDDSEIEAMLNPNSREFLAALGLPEEAIDAPAEWPGLIIKIVCDAIELLSKSFFEEDDQPESAAQVIADVLACDIERNEKREDWADRTYTEIELRTSKQEDLARNRLSIPGEVVLDKLMRYEAHLARQSRLAMDELERLQARRSGSQQQPGSRMERIAAAECRIFDQCSVYRSYIFTINKIEVSTKLRNVIWRKSISRHFRTSILVDNA